MEGAVATVSTADNKAKLALAVQERLARAITLINTTPVGKIASERDLVRVSSKRRFELGVGRLVDTNVGYCLVMKRLSLRAIFTERDALRCALDTDPHARIVDVATRDPICLTTDQTVRDALAIVHEHDFRHIPIRNRSDRYSVAGMISLRGIASYLHELMSTKRLIPFDLGAADQKLATLFHAQPIISCSRDTLMADAIALMNHHGIGALAVTEFPDSKVLCGILSERDVVRCMVARRFEPEWKEAKVSEAMTQRVWCRGADEPLLNAIDGMLGKHFRHLPLVRYFHVPGQKQDRVEVQHMVGLRDFVHTVIKFLGKNGLDLSLPG